MIKKLIPSKTWLTYDTNPSIKQKCALVDINNLNQADFDCSFNEEEIAFNVLSIT